MPSIRPKGLLKDPTMFEGTPMMAKQIIARTWVRAHTYTHTLRMERNILRASRGTAQVRQDSGKLPEPSNLTPLD
eukprot:2734611-Pyramimonas_sp.AAC.1